MRIRRRTGPKYVANESAIALARAADALAHPLRIEIFKYVIRCNRERVAVRNKDLVESFGYSQATVSQHVNMLKEGGLLTAHAQGTSTCYYANIGAIGKFMSELSDLGE